MKKEKLILNKKQNINLKLKINDKVNNKSY